MTSRPAIARARLEEIPAGTELLREVRFMHDEDFATCSTDDLTHAARWLRAAAYSAAEGARRLDAIARKRTTTTTEEKDPSTCTSDPATTATSTSTDEPPTASPPSPARKSPSSRKRTAPE